MLSKMSYLYTRMTTDGEETCEDDPAKEGGKHNGMKTNCEVDSNHFNDMSTGLERDEILGGKQSECDFGGSSVIEEHNFPGAARIISGGGKLDMLENNSSIRQSELLNPESMKGLPLKARNLLNKYTGYDPMESLVEASLSISGMPIYSSGRGRRRSRRRKRRKNTGSKKNLKYIKKTVPGLGDLPLHKYSTGKGVAHDTRMRVVAEGKRTIRLLNLRACSKDDILGVMLGGNVDFAKEHYFIDVSSTASTYSIDSIP